MRTIDKITIACLRYVRTGEDKELDVLENALTELGKTFKIPLKPINPTAVQPYDDMLGMLERFIQNKEGYITNIPFFLTLLKMQRK